MADPCVVDLKRIRNPMVIFASSGDNITPPHQALAWLPAIYPDTPALKTAGQRIVYLLNPHVGHLGIFVSASVAQHLELVYAPGASIDAVLSIIRLIWLAEYLR